MAFDFGILQPYVNDAMIRTSTAMEEPFIQRTCRKEKAERRFWSQGIWSSC